MLDRVPVPTDNIYKFYALFSLVAIVFCVWLFFSKHAETNAVIMKNYPEIAELKATKDLSPTQQAKLKVLESYSNVMKADNNFVQNWLVALVILFFVAMLYGFFKWHKEVQPIVDENQKAQLLLLQLQVAKLRLENQKLAESVKADVEQAKADSA